MTSPLFRAAGPLDDEAGLHLLTLNHLLLGIFGPTYLTWTSQALRRELTERIGDPGVLTWERIQAGRVMVLHDAFWKEWEVFENCSAAIVGDPPVFSFMQPMDAEEIAVALETARRINDGNVYDEDVKGYITSTLLHDGLWFYEDPLDIATPDLLQHDREKNIERDFGSVGRVLQRTGKMIKSPETAAEVQANNVIGVRQVLEDYISEIDSQLKTVPALAAQYRRSA